MTGRAWLEAVNGGTVDLQSPFKIGRDPAASLTLDDDRASREHVMLNSDPADGGWWLTDLGSTNGTYVNGLRVAEATRLDDGDRIRVGHHHWLFRSEGPRSDPRAIPVRETVATAEEADCWMLLGDVVGSSTLVEHIGTLDYMAQLGAWMDAQEEVIRAAGGFINERMGDGFLAIWDAQRVPPDRLAACLDRIRAMQSDTSPPHRFLLHAGTLTVGGGGRGSGVERLTGRALNLLFKAERALPDRDPGLFLSAAARTRLVGQNLKLAAMGEFAIEGFESQPWYRVEN